MIALLATVCTSILDLSIIAIDSSEEKASYFEFSDKIPCVPFDGSGYHGV